MTPPTTLPAATATYESSRYAGDGDIRSATNLLVVIWEVLSVSRFVKDFLLPWMEFARNVAETVVWPLLLAYWTARLLVIAGQWFHRHFIYKPNARDLYLQAITMLQDDDALFRRKRKRQQRRRARNILSGNAVDTTGRGDEEELIAYRQVEDLLKQAIACDARDKKLWKPPILALGALYLHRLEQPNRTVALLQDHFGYCGGGGDGDTPLSNASTTADSDVQALYQDAIALQQDGNSKMVLGQLGEDEYLSLHSAQIHCAARKRRRHC